MTPKEKAIDLYDKFIDSYDLFGKRIANECALIAVDEIINSNPTSQFSDPFLGNRTYENVNYWQEVKQEIEKL